MRHAPPPLLALIIVIYVALSAAYAVYTPTWQIPDEPAHYNYIADIVHTGRLPVLEAGDYPFDYLEKIKAEKFPPPMAIDNIDYEAWQPPLYYLLAAPLFVTTDDLPLATHVIALRFLSIAAGAILLYITYQLVKVVFPEDNTLAITATTFVAFIPMHIAMSAGINNDALAELIIAGILLVGLLRINGRLPTRAFVISGGALYGLGLLTKGTVYPSAAILLAAEATYRWTKEDDSGSLLRSLFFLFAIAIALSAWWFVRNGVVYDNFDIFGRQRHDIVVTGQPRTADWIADYGWGAYWARAWNFTFKSFWGVFGWMGVFMDQRLYTSLLILTALAAAGCGLFIVRALRNPTRLSPQQRASLGVLALNLVLTVGTYAWYNFTFVQHQGRYLFPALVPIALFAALGFRELVPRVIQPVAVGLLIAGFVGLDIISLTWFIVPNL
ncbi:MAG: hypothetical protein MAG451_01315 [Anaerolineales bacterium]|nr:hypothetical protein [Anaerolineales bacterium]